MKFYINLKESIQGKREKRENKILLLDVVSKFFIGIQTKYRELNYEKRFHTKGN